MTTITSISRGQIAQTLAQAHGPFMLHLEPHDRIRLLQYMATIYSCLGYRRKEVYVLRELLSTMMDVVVCSRDEFLKSSQVERGKSVLKLDMGNVGLRESEIMDGNDSVIRLVKYVCEVYGVDLTEVKLLGPGDEGKVSTPEDEPVEGHKMQYGWDELQLGVVREAVAIVEALPGLPFLCLCILQSIQPISLDYAIVAQFDLSALKALRAVLAPSDQTYLYTNSAKALVTARRRGDDRRIEYWSGNPVVSIEVTP